MTLAEYQVSYGPVYSHIASQCGVTSQAISRLAGGIELCFVRLEAQTERDTIEMNAQDCRFPEALLAAKSSKRTSQLVDTSSAVPRWLAAEAGNQKIHKAAYLRREMPAGRIEGVQRLLRRRVIRQ